LRKYELMFITQPDLEDEERQDLVARIKQTMIDHGAEILVEEDRGTRTLAYPIAKRREGHYTLIRAHMERPAIQAVERALTLSEDVMRHLLVRVDEDTDVQEEDVDEE